MDLCRCTAYIASRAVCRCVSSMVTSCFESSGTKEVAKQEDVLLRRATIRHTDCAVLLSPALAATRCSHCESHRHTLRSLASQMEKNEHRETTDKTAPDSHVNYRYLRTPEKAHRLKRMHSELAIVHVAIGGRALVCHLVSLPTL